MKSRKRAGLVALGSLALVGPGLAWYMRGQGIQIGEAPYRVMYFPKEQINRPPVINWTPKYGPGLTYPKTLQISFEAYKESGHAGFLVVELPSDDLSNRLVRRETGGGLLRIGDLEYAVNCSQSVVIHGERPPRAYKSYFAFGVPYALGPDHRQAKVRLAEGSEWILIELPRAPSHSKPKLADSSVTSGPFQIVAKPMPWRATNAPMEYDIVVEGPSGREFLIQLDEPFECQGIQGKSGQSFRTHVDPRQTAALAGTICELSAHPLQFRWKTQNYVISSGGAAYETSLFLNGQAVYGIAARVIEQPYDLYRVGEVVFGDPTRSFEADLRWQRRSPLRLGPTKGQDGQQVKGFGYRIVKEHKFKLPLNHPISSEMLSFGTQFP